MFRYKSCILVQLTANTWAKVFVPSATLGQTLVRRGIIFPLSRAFPPFLLADFHSPGPPSPFLARTDNYAPRARQMRASEGGRERNWETGGNPSQRIWWLQTQFRIVGNLASHLLHEGGPRFNQPRKILPKILPTSLSNSYIKQKFKTL